MARDYDYRGLKVHAIELQKPATKIEANGGEYGAVAVAEHLREHVERLRPDIHAYHLAGLGASVIDVLAPQRVPLLYTATDFWSVCTRSILVKPSGEMCSGPDEISSNCLECFYGERLVSRNVPAGAGRRRAMYRKLASRALARRPGEHPNMRAIRVMLGRNDFVRERINSVDAVLGSDAAHGEDADSERDPSRAGSSFPLWTQARLRRRGPRAPASVLDRAVRLRRNAP